RVVSILSLPGAEELYSCDMLLWFDGTQDYLLPAGLRRAGSSRISRRAVAQWTRSRLASLIRSTILACSTRSKIKIGYLHDKTPKGAHPARFFPLRWEPEKSSKARQALLSNCQKV